MSKLAAAVLAMEAEELALFQVEDGLVEVDARVAVEEEVVVAGVPEQPPLVLVAPDSGALATCTVAAAGYAAGASESNTVDATSMHVDAAVPYSSTVLDRDPWEAWAHREEPWQLPSGY